MDVGEISLVMICFIPVAAIAIVCYLKADRLEAQVEKLDSVVREQENSIKELAFENEEWRRKDRLKWRKAE